MKLFKNENDLIIYGAGNYGQRAYEFIEELGLLDQLLCFAVSEKMDNEDRKNNLPVISFQEVLRKHSEANIIFAINNQEELFQQISLSHKGEVIRFTNEFVNDFCCVETFWTLPIDSNKIVFVMNNGNGYMCNGKYITEQMLAEKRNVDIVWALADISQDLPDAVRKVKYRSPAYYRELATAKVWVDNGRKTADIKKREGQIYIQTWHGSGPLKKVEKDVEEILSDSYLEKAKIDGKMIDYFFSATSANTYMFEHSFYSSGKVIEIGSARNDVMFTNDTQKIMKIRKALGIKDDEKKIVLYAPTFRQSIEESIEKYDIDVKKTIHALEQRFGGTYKMVVRFHPDISHNEKLRELFSDCINATLYPDTQELLMISDVLITDYSSILWDFSLSLKPLFLYQNDAKEYLDERGFYSDPNSWPYPKAYDIDDLCRTIEMFDEKYYQNMVSEFLKEWNSFDDGNASKRASEFISSLLKKEI